MFSKALKSCVGYFDLRGLNETFVDPFKIIISAIALILILLIPISYGWNLGILNISTKGKSKKTISVKVPVDKAKKDEPSAGKEDSFKTSKSGIFENSVKGRRKLSKQIEEDFKKQGLPVQVQTQGEADTTVKIVAKFIAGQIIDRILNDKDFENSLRRVGFKYIILTNVKETIVTAFKIMNNQIKEDEMETGGCWICHPGMSSKKNSK
jgi:fructose-specific phosphotransferase system component IIB